MKVTIMALALALSPGLAAAMCSDRHSASACGEGQVFDTVRGECVTTSS